MVRIKANRSDPPLESILKALEEYKREHPRARCDAYRRNSVSIRVRVIDPGFKGKDLVDRDPYLWTYLERLPEDVQSEISMLVLITPGEAKKSFANLEYENPSPSLL
jgi:hypothetical protein